MPYLNKMKPKIEDIIFWILVAIIVIVVIWILSGSPPIENSLPSLIIFVIASEILLWKALFSIDKKTEIGFVKVKNKIANLENNMNNRFKEINKRLDNIEILIKQR